jgi:hypothetical protein
VHTGIGSSTNEVFISSPLQLYLIRIIRCVAVAVLIDSSAPPFLVYEALMALMGVPGAPTWIRKACGQLLSRNLRRPGGLAAMIENIFGTDQARRTSPSTPSNRRSIELSLLRFVE